MTDYNSVKADEYLRRQGGMDELDADIDASFDIVTDELPSWLSVCDKDVYKCAVAEAKRRVMQAIKERSEP